MNNEEEVHQLYRKWEIFGGLKLGQIILLRVI